MSQKTRASAIAADGFARLLGTELVLEEPDRVIVRLPYTASLGEDRIHGGAICALADIAATAAFWSDPTLDDVARGATVDLSIHFLRLSTGRALLAEATVRRRGGTLCTGDVSVQLETGEELAVARVTYKLSR